jgi:hypothetical protein
MIVVQAELTWSIIVNPFVKFLNHKVAHLGAQYDEVLNDVLTVYVLNLVLLLLNSTRNEHMNELFKRINGEISI